MTQEGCEIERINPTTGEVASIETAHNLDACLTFAVLSAAAFPHWSRTPVSQRAALLERVADRLLNQSDELCQSMVQEIGATTVWARYNVTFAAEMLCQIATYSDEVGSVEDISNRDGVWSRAERTACGVCLSIAPWNAPVILGVRAVAAALLCGNTVLLKGNELAPRTFRLLGEIFQKSGFPQNVVKVFITRPEDSEATVEALIASPVVRRVNFTGSTRVGRRIAELCAKYLKRPLLQLGGQANLIVLDDADLEAAAEAAVKGAFLNQGQMCMSTERLIVFDEITDELIARIETKRKKLRLGNPAIEGTDIGPVVSIAAADRLSALISDALSKGAKLVGGGIIRDSFVEPTILEGVEPDMRLYNEEVFGPVLSVTRVSNEQEAITVANDSDYGLAAAVFGNDLTRAQRVARQLHSGICHINRATADDDPRAPFGGVKSSGYGRFGGRWSINEFTEIRWITSKSIIDSE